MRITQIFRFSNYIQISNGRLVSRPLFCKKNKDKEKETEKEKEKNISDKNNSEKKEGFPWE